MAAAAGGLFIASVEPAAAVGASAAAWSSSGAAGDAETAAGETKTAAETVVRSNAQQLQQWREVMDSRLDSALQQQRTAVTA